MPVRLRQRHAGPSLRPAVEPHAAHPGDADVRLEGIWRAYGDTAAVAGVDLAIAPGRENVAR
jgi:hypothetical protein